MNPVSRPLNLLGQHEYHGAPFPLALKVTADSLEATCAWITENATDLDAQAAAHGAVLLRGLPLASLTPPLQLEVIDIDAADVDPSLRARYDLEVPVLALGSTPLPRVSPRLQGDGLYTWLQRACTSALGSD